MATSLDSTQFEVLRSPDGSGLKLIGELDLGSAPHLVEELNDPSLAAQRTTLDLSELSFVDSTGIHVILGLARSQAGSEPVVLLDPTPAVTRAFEILSLNGHDGIEIRRSAASSSP